MEYSGRSCSTALATVIPPMPESKMPIMRVSQSKVATVVSGLIRTAVKKCRVIYTRKQQEQQDDRMGEQSRLENICRTLLNSLEEKLRRGEIISFSPALPVDSEMQEN